MFHVHVDIDGRRFEGRGSSKKLAKLNCAATAMLTLDADGHISDYMARKEKRKAHRNAGGGDSSIRGGGGMSGGSVAGGGSGGGVGGESERRHKDPDGRSPRD